MMVSSKSLPEALRGGAWPTSARAVRCPVKSGNERDPYFQLLTLFSEGVHSERAANDKLEEGVGDVRSVCPEFPGLHAAYNA